MSRLNTRQRIAVLPWSTPGLLQRANITEQQAMDAAWFVDEQGRRYRGAHAISEVLVALHHIFLPTRWLYAVPGLHQLADRAYQWVADNRYRLPGSTAACAVPPKNKSSSSQSST